MSATTDQVYDRWLKDSEPWLQEDDWNSTEYFKWVKRLAQAKANLDDKYIEVDLNVRSNVYHKAAAMRRPFFRTVQTVTLVQLNSGM